MQATAKITTLICALAISCLAGCGAEDDGAGIDNAGQIGILGPLFLPTRRSPEPQRSGPKADPNEMPVEAPAQTIDPCRDLPSEASLESCLLQVAALCQAQGGTYELGACTLSATAAVR